jgi:hypothetical protein
MTDTIYLLILIALAIVVFFGDIKLSDSLPDTNQKLLKKKDDFKKLLVVFFLFMSAALNGQNFQVLSGIGSDKSKVNFVTAELYKPLEHGTFYGFTDLKLNKNGYFDSYTEIFKYWNIGKNGYSVTGQINAGLFTTEGIGIQINPVYLVGVSKACSIGELVLTLDVLYRMDQGFSDTTQTIKIGNGFQLTGTFLRDWNKFQISGYCDIWKTKNSKYYNKNRNSLIVQFEPQAWWKFSKKLYLGIEGRISNFNDPDLGLYEYSNYCMVGLKWILE